MEKEKFISLLDNELADHPEYCEDVLKVVSESLNRFRNKALAQSTALADNAINSLSGYIDEKNVNYEFLIDAVLHECRSLFVNGYVSSSESTRKMIKKFTNHLKNKSAEDLLQYLNFVERTRGTDKRALVVRILEIY